MKERRNEAGSAKWLSACLGAMVIVGGLSSSTAQATSGTMTINSSGTTTLTEDHVGTIIVSANWAILDCAGHTVRDSSQDLCEGGTAECGIEVRGDFVDVRNCSTRGHEIGISVTADAFNPWVYDNSIVLNTLGLSVRGPTSPYLFDNTLLWNTWGVEIRDAGDLHFQDSAVLQSGGDGIDINFTAGAHILDSNVSGNADHNVEIDDSQSVRAERNTFDGETNVFGVVMTTPSDNFQVEEVTNIQVHDNVSVQAGRNGFYIRDVTNGSVTGNNASQSGDNDCRERDSSGISYSGNSFPVNLGCN